MDNVIDFQATVDGARVFHTDTHTHTGHRSLAASTCVTFRFPFFNILCTSMSVISQCVHLHEWFHRRNVLLLIRELKGQTLCSYISKNKVV